MKVSVIVPAFNEEKLISDSLASIRTAMTAFDEKGWVTELIVSDNNSTDRTPALAREAGAMVVFEPVNQIARARNKGAEAASGEWLVFIDADSYPEKALFGKVAEAVETGKFVFGGSTVKLQGRYMVAGFITEFWNQISRTMNYAAGSFIFCEAAAFRKVGGFDVAFYAGEEIDLSKRLKKFARTAGKRAIILDEYPLVTSARKMELYSAREHLRFMFGAICGGTRIARDREACFLWYDGRR